MIRYATRAIDIDGDVYNAGDIIPMHVQIDDESDAVRYEGKTPDTKARKQAAESARQELKDTGLTSASFSEEKITTKPAEEGEEVKVLLQEDEETTTEDPEDLKEETTEVETETPPARGRGRNAASE